MLVIKRCVVHNCDCFYNYDYHQEEEANDALCPGHWELVSCLKRRCKCGSCCSLCRSTTPSLAKETNNSRRIYAWTTWRTSFWQYWRRSGIAKPTGYHYQEKHFILTLSLLVLCGHYHNLCCLRSRSRRKVQDYQNYCTPLLSLHSNCWILSSRSCPTLM